MDQAQNNSGTASPQSFEEVADKCGLNAGTKRRYVTYMRSRWPRDEQRMCADYYAAEWAQRFAAGMEYAKSDLHGKMVLRTIDGIEQSESQGAKT